MFDKLLKEYTDHDSVELIVTLACYYYNLKLLSIQSENNSSNNIEEMNKVLHKLNIKEAVQYLHNKQIQDNNVAMTTVTTEKDVVTSIKKQLKSYSHMLLDTTKAKEIKVDCP